MNEFAEILNLFIANVISYTFFAAVYGFIIYTVTNQIQFQLVITHKLPQFRNIKGCESCTTTDQNRFCCLTRDKLSRTFSSNSQKI